MKRSFGEPNPERIKESAFGEAEKLLAKVVEKGGSLDLSALSNLRKQLNQHLFALGALNDDGSIDIDKWQKVATGLFRRKNIPLKPENYPSEAEFSSGLEKVKKQESALFIDVSPRGSATLEEYLYGVGTVMSSKLAYESIFNNDPIIISTEGKVENGRHRMIAKKVLDEIGFDTKWDWVKTETE